MPPYVVSRINRGQARYCFLAVAVPAPKKTAEMLQSDSTYYEGSKDQAST